jgi:hypothetical protein
MTEIITEALLEMHFHAALVQYFQSIYGSNFLKLLKPSPQQEAWVGFDQSWASTSLTTRQLFEELRTAIQEKRRNISNFYFGYFLQFKAVEKKVRRSRLMPAQYNTPYFRSQLSLQPNRSTGLSQHETLLRLNNIFGSIVRYACAMLFDPADIWQQPDINKLRLIDISTAPSGWATNQPHFITFQTENDQSPNWFSEAVEGKSIGFADWASPDMDFIHPIDAEALIELLQTTYKELKGLGEAEQLSVFEYSDFINVMPDALTILEFGKRTKNIK